VSPIHEHCKLNAFGPAKVNEGGDGGAHRPASEENLIYKNDAFPVHVEGHA
jgi:hypothetical protein